MNLRTVDQLLKVIAKKSLENRQNYFLNNILNNLK